VIDAMERVNVSIVCAHISHAKLSVLLVAAGQVMVGAEGAVGCHQWSGGRCVARAACGGQEAGACVDITLLLLLSLLAVALLARATSRLESPASTVTYQ
jgi:hypothetical protein